MTKTHQERVEIQVEKTHRSGKKKKINKNQQKKISMKKPTVRGKKNPRRPHKKNEQKNLSEQKPATKKRKKRKKNPQIGRTISKNQC